MSKRCTAVALAAALGVAAPLMLSASPAQAAPSIPIPIPTVQVTEVCGPRNDIVTVDPAWTAEWGDKVTIYPASLTFQGGNDGDYSKPAGQIFAEYRNTYYWEGFTSGWSTWSLYPGTVTPILDRNTPCEVAEPNLVQTEVRGPRNDVVSFADAESAAAWEIVSQTWQGNTLTVSLRTREGYVGPNGITTLTRVFVDQVKNGQR